MDLTLAIIAAGLNFVGYVPYVNGIIKNKVKPHQYTWGIWSVLTTIVAINQISNGGGYSSIFFVTTCFWVITTFLLSLKYGVGGASNLDKVCLGLAALLLVFWLSLQETRISTLVAVIIDGLGAVPTAVKTFRQPGSEAYMQWLFAGIGGFITLLIVPRFDWALIIYPIYVVGMNATIVGIKYCREH